MEMEVEKWGGRGASRMGLHVVYCLASQGPLSGPLHPAFSGISTRHAKPNSLCAHPRPHSLCDVEGRTTPRSQMGALFQGLPRSPASQPPGLGGLASACDRCRAHCVMACFCSASDVPGGGAVAFTLFHVNALIVEKPARGYVFGPGASRPDRELTGPALGPARATSTQPAHLEPLFSPFVSSATAALN
ncbi:hypothetical protein DPEC_G00328840 [Dallia pectoralis]|uniref:Uncharacterized protein n=1 Tax=Dallia pectoralis TaxID=75939 RepID=A0ACC2F8F7_DALPE|nr:hypothetical protein DPEC_G00328840 [Dallia pectoralis]